MEQENVMYGRAEATRWWLLNVTVVARKWVSHWSYNHFLNDFDVTLLHHEQSAKETLGINMPTDRQTVG